MSPSTIPDWPITPIVQKPMGEAQRVTGSRGRSRVAVFGLLALLATPILAEAAPRYGSGYGPRQPSNFARASRIPLGLRPFSGRAPGDHIYRHGYRQESTLLLTPSGHVLAFPTVTPVPGNASYGAPLHGIVCSKGTIAELPAERQQHYTDGATVGLPGQRCLNFSQQ